MTTIKILTNRIRMAFIAIPMLVSALSVPVHAEVPTTGGSVIPVTQKWTRNDGGDTSVTYMLAPVGELEDSGVKTNTAKALNDGDVSYTVTIENGHTIGNRYVLIGNDRACFSFSWTKAGVYIFDLEPVNREVVFDDGHGYHYDHTTYRIRLYAKNDGEAFFTVQNLDKSEDEDAGKIGDIVYKHQYIGVKKDDDGGGTDTNDGDHGGSNSGSTPITDKKAVTADTDTQNPDIDDTASDDTIGRIDEDGNRGDNDMDGDGTRVYGTGDSSPIVLYGAITFISASVLIIWFVTRKKKN